MKIKSLKAIIGASVALVVAVGVWSPLHLQAGDQVKGAAKLLSAPTATVQPAVDQAGMSCPKCKTVAAQYVSTERGNIQTVTTGTKHLCEACSTKLVTQGTGKAATTVAQHSCAMGDKSPAACCGK